MTARNQKAKSGCPVWPLIATALLICVACYLFYLLWRCETAIEEAYRGQQAAIAALETKRDSLKGILALSPCAAQEALINNRALK